MLLLQQITKDAQITTFSKHRSGIKRHYINI